MTLSLTLSTVSCVCPCSISSSPPAVRGPGVLSHTCTRSPATRTYSTQMTASVIRIEKKQWKRNIFLLNTVIVMTWSDWLPTLVKSGIHLHLFGFLLERLLVDLQLLRHFRSRLTRPVRILTFDIRICLYSSFHQNRSEDWRFSNYATEKAFRM